MLTLNNTFIFSTNYSDPLLLKDSLYSNIVEAVLLSEKYTTPAALKKIDTAKQNNCLIISDNGNFTRMSNIAKKFAKKGLELQQKAEISMAKNKFIEDEILLKRSLLINEIEDACKLALETTNQVQIIAKQLKSNPHYMIGLEDYTIPVITMAGLFHPVFEPQTVDVLAFQQNTLNLYLSQKNGLWCDKNLLTSIRKYIVMHSYDYLSAKQGTNLYNNEVEGVSISFGGPMASRDYISSIKVGTTTEVFTETLPEPYILATAIVIGATDGLTNKTMPIHILGLGSPILIVLLGYLLRKNSLVSIDATSTFKDADDGNIYGSKNGFLKLDMYKVAAFALINNEPYTSNSPCFQDFESKFPSNWLGLRNELKITNHSIVSEVVELLKNNPALIEKYIPYFTPMRKGNDSLIKLLRIARAGSNYWVLKKICEEIRKRKDNEIELKKWVLFELDRYSKNASKKWAAAIVAIIKIMEKNKI